MIIIGDYPDYTRTIDHDFERGKAYKLMSKIAINNWIGTRKPCYPTRIPPIDDGIRFIDSGKVYVEYAPLHGGYRRALLWNFTPEGLARVMSMMEEDIQVIKLILAQLEEE
jgi:hypothetical protein